METKLRQVHKLTITCGLSHALTWQCIHIVYMFMYQMQSRFPQTLRPGKPFLKQQQHNNVAS